MSRVKLGAESDVVNVSSTAAILIYGLPGLGRFAAP
jgi:hypothetical protein